jgi:uncharacterized protein (TIGR00369 family)
LPARKDFNQHLGIRVVRRYKDGLTIECRLREELHNLAGVLHGGVTATLVDVAGGMAIMHRGHVATTVELKINYLRPVTGRKVTARSHLLRIGKTLVTAQVDVYDDRKNHAAVGLVTYMMLDGKR